jgi:ribonuclease HI
MNNIKLFCDGSVNPQKKIGFGSYFLYRKIDTIEIAKESIKTKKFEDTSSTKLELEVLLWALDDEELKGKNIQVYTDCQNILGLESRREKLENHKYKTSTGKILKNYILYKNFYKKIDELECEFIKVKGHKPSKEKDLIDDLFTLVDKSSRNTLRESVNPPVSF